MEPVEEDPEGGLNSDDNKSNNDSNSIDSNEDSQDDTVNDQNKRISCRSKVNFSKLNESEKVMRL